LDLFLRYVPPISSFRTTISFRRPSVPSRRPTEFYTNLLVFVFVFSSSGWSIHSRRSTELERIPLLDFYSGNFRSKNSPNI
jgi:hypothetical protein